MHVLKVTDSKNFAVFFCGNSGQLSEVLIRLFGSLIASKRESKSVSKSIHVNFLPISSTSFASLKKSDDTVVLSSLAKPSDMCFLLFSPPSTAIAWL